MKKRILLWGLALCLLLSGCASLLERSYSSSAAHVDKPTTAEDSSVLRVENYRELVSAVLYLVSQGQEEGVIQLYNYDGEVDSDLTAACQEVANQDPLGAYAVDYIKHESSRVVSYYQATVSIGYRRSLEQIQSMVNVTGSGAIRAELRGAMSEFADRVVLRVAYFSEDEQSIRGLLRQAYYDAPAAAFGIPQAQIALYPDSGRERVVEIILTYPDSAEALSRKSKEVTERAAALAADLAGLSPRTAAAEAAAALGDACRYDPEGGGTAYDALVEGSANAEGMALAWELICQQAGMDAEIVEGERDGGSWFWNALSLEGGQVLYLDPSALEGKLYTAEELVWAGYRWPGQPETAAMTE